MAHQDGSTRDSGEAAKKAFDWTRKTKEFLTRLQEPLSGTIKFWERFNSSNGDIGYFSDIKSSDDLQNRINLSLRAINEIVETLEELQRTLDILIGFCDDYSNAVS